MRTPLGDLPSDCNIRAPLDRLARFGSQDCKWRGSLIQIGSRDGEQIEYVYKYECGGL